MSTRQQNDSPFIRHSLCPACPPHTQPRPLAPHTAASCSSSSPTQSSGPQKLLQLSQVAAPEQQPVQKLVDHALHELQFALKIQLNGLLEVGLRPGLFCRPTSTRKYLLDHSFVLTEHQVVGQIKVGQFVRDRRLGQGDLGKAVVVWTSTLWGPVLLFDLEEVRL